ncbi:MAG: DUF362 domain-containing protein [Methanomicrobiaceae archaeon]|nr:DUF362 domain-containing protein [Methanomicrobiaceae archaeon]
MNRTGKVSVSVARCTNYDPAGVRTALDACLLPLGGMGRCVRPGDRVLIKPNLLASKDPSSAVTTHPSVVRAVVELVQEKGATAIVGDSPGGRNTPSSYRALLKRTGMLGVCEDTGAEPVYFDSPTMTVVSESARTFRKFTVTGALNDVDTVIGVSKLKTHLFMHYTGAVKLLYGYIPGVAKAEYHLHAGRDMSTFARLLLDLHATFPPSLSIMDAVVGMEGLGPQHGKPRKIGLLMASPSAPALDMASSSVVGFDPLSIPTIRGAVEEGTGPASLEEVDWFGPPLEEVKVPDFVPSIRMNPGRVPPFLYAFAQRLAAASPVIDQNACIRCGTCAQDCPPGAIRFIPGSYPSIEYGKCIRCFCCHELCPAGAVSVKVPLLRRMLG